MEKPIITLREPTAIAATTKRVDAFSDALDDLFFIENPHLRSSMPGVPEQIAAYVASSPFQPIWIYYPWRDVLVKSLPEDAYYRVRTARNRNLITPEEQQRYRATRVGIAGLSVGSSIVHALAVGGGPQYMRIADFDTLAVSNLNRIQATLLDVGTPKTTLAAQRVWELDPFAEMVAWETGVTADNLEDFIVGDTPLDVFIDEMDSLDLKFLAREICKKHRIPVLMATDNGDGALLDVERFDLDPDQLPFHGALGDMDRAAFHTVDKREWSRIVTRIIDPHAMTERLQSTMLELGKTLTSPGQLGTAAAIGGAAAAFAVRQIANKASLPSGKFRIALEDALIPAYNDEPTRTERDAASRRFMDAMGIS